MARSIFCVLVEFPPLNVAGVFRPLRFINALAENGYDVTVLTISESTVLSKLTKNRIDTSLLNLVDQRINVIRVPFEDNNTHKSNFQSFITNWRNSAGDDYYNSLSKLQINHIEDEILKRRTDIIFVSAPPFSMASFGATISKKYGIPLVLDMRDAWLGWTMVPFPSFDYYLRRKIRERRVFKQSKYIISVTPELIQKFKTSHPNISEEKFSLIYNSPNQHFVIPDLFVSQGLNSKSIIQIGYTGSFYYKPILTFKEKLKKPHRFFQFQKKTEDWKFRSPYYFFQVFRIFLDQNKDLRKRVIFNYIGDPEKWLIQMIEEFNLKSNVKIHGVLPYDATLKLEGEFDYLLSTSEKSLESRHFCLPSKLFNYVKSARPILAFVTNGPQKEFIEKTNSGVVLDPMDIDNSTKRFTKVMLDGCSLKTNQQEFSKYSLEATNNQFVNLIEEVYK
jgi:hypothetical protein